MANRTDKLASLPVLGKVGDKNVVDFNGTPCLVFEGKRLIGPSKIKDVLSDTVGCKEFLAQYDKPKPKAKPASSAAASPLVDLSKVKTKEDALKQLDELQALLAKINSKDGGSRVDPLSKAA